MTKLHQGYERLNKEIIYWINQSAEIDLDRDNRVWTEKNKKELYEEFWKISNSINNDCFHDISKMDDKSYISAITDVMTELGSVYLEFYSKSAKIKFNAVPDHDDTLGKILNYSKYKLDSNYIRDMSHNYTKSKLVARYPIRQFLLCNFLALIYDNTKHKFSYLTKLFYNLYLYS